MSAALIESPPTDLHLLWAAQSEGEQDAAGHELPHPDFQPEAHIAASSVPMGVVGLVSAPAVDAGSSLAQLGRAAVAFAESRVGWTEQPAFSNLIFAWADMKPEWQGNPWCAASFCDSWARQGIDLRQALENPYYCPFLEQLAKDHGAWHSRGSGYSPTSGDAVLYGSGDIATHIGMAAPTSESYAGYRAIEGNTMPQGAVGSQTNGNGQYIRYRPTNGFLRGWINMQVLVPALEKAGRIKVLPQTPLKTNGLRAEQPAHTPTPISLARTIQGITSGRPSGNVRIVQQMLRANGGLYAGALDGLWGAQTLAAYAHYQRICGYSGDDANGIPGPATFKRLVQWRNSYTAIA